MPSFAFILSRIAIFCAAGIEGYFWRPLSVIPRIIIGVGGCMLVLIQDITSLAIAIVVIAAGIFISSRQDKPTAIVGAH